MGSYLVAARKQVLSEGSRKIAHREPSTVQGVKLVVLMPLLLQFHRLSARQHLLLRISAEAFVG